MSHEFPGRLDWGYDPQDDGRAAVFDDYEFRADQIAALAVEQRDITIVLDVKAPPWQADRVGPSLYSRAIPGYGTVWYTLVRGETGHPMILFLNGTCEGTDADDPNVQAARQAAAAKRVGELLQAGKLYHWNLTKHWDLK